MKSLFLAFVIFCITLFSACTEKTVEIRYDQFWEPLTYPLGTYINTLLITKSNYILAGTTTKGILISKDKWKTWNKVTGISDSYIYLIKQITDGRIFAQSQKKLYISNDEGQSWTEQVIPLPETDTIFGYRPAIASNGILGYNGNSNQKDYTYKYYLSTNMGATWDTIPFSIYSQSNVNLEGNDKVTVLTIAANTTTVYLKQKNETTFNQIYKFNDNLSTYLKTHLIKDVIYLTYPYALRSTDLGKTWNSLDAGLIQSMTSSPVYLNYSYNQNVAVLSYYGALYYSINDGNSWNYIDTGVNGIGNSFYITNDYYLINYFGGVWAISRKPII